jgi:IMP dehydrogenase
MPSCRQKIIASSLGCFDDWQASIELLSTFYIIARLFTAINKVIDMLRIAKDALTFDDVLLIPGFSEVLPKEVSLKTRLTRDIELNMPLVSAAMDTVTESTLAIAMAQEGGIGIIHKNMTIEKQAAAVKAVKKFESGVVKDPITVSPRTTVGEVLEVTAANKISGLPVVDGKDLVGIVTGRDIRFVNKPSTLVSEIMTPKEKLVTVKEGAGTDEVKDMLHKYRIEKVLVVNDQFELCGLITVKDIQKSQDFPFACKDERGQLRVGAAVGTGDGTEERIAALVEAGVDVIVVDTAHGHSAGVIERVRWAKQRYPQIQIIGGNIATAEAAIDLADAGADAVKVGIGPGSICTTRIVAGIGVPQITAVADVAFALKDRDIPVIADGGIRFSGDIAKAIAAGAHNIMIGSLLAGTDEAPGEIELFQGRSYKAYRGMGSIGAMGHSQGSSDRYFQDIRSGVDKLVPEGIEGRVACKGPMTAIVHQLLGGLRASMGYTGCRNIEEMRTKPQFSRITSAGMQESHVHDVTITKEAPNYRIS